MATGTDVKCACGMCDVRLTLIDTVVGDGTPDGDLKPVLYMRMRDDSDGSVVSMKVDEQVVDAIYGAWLDVQTKASVVRVIQHVGRGE